MGTEFLTAIGGSKTQIGVDLAACTWRSPSSSSGARWSISSASGGPGSGCCRSCSGWGCSSWHAPSHAQPEPDRVLAGDGRAGRSCTPRTTSPATGSTCRRSTSTTRRSIRGRGSAPTGWRCLVGSSPLVHLAGKTKAGLGVRRGRRPHDRDRAGQRHRHAAPAGARIRATSRGGQRARHASARAYLDAFEILPSPSRRRPSCWRSCSVTGWATS